MEKPKSEAESARGEVLRGLPRVDAVLAAAPVAELAARKGRGLALFFVRKTLDSLRSEALDGRLEAPAREEDLLDLAARRTVAAAGLEGDPLPRILNATGVILHSGLGRAPLPPSAAQAVQRAAGYALLEVDRDQGARKSRDSRAGALLAALTGAEASLVVNNNAAATLLILSALASGRDVVCSRGEMVEIGGSYRIPDVCEASGCRLVAVGCTNKTRLEDYERATTPDCAAILAVHTSNYRIVGFTEAPELKSLATFARSRGIPLIHDLGSGSLLGPEQLGFGDEPPVSASLRAGADVVCMSGDKLLGGPQAGIILGRRDLVDRMRRHPLARALRVDKMTLAALEGTLQLFLDPERLRSEHTVIRLLTMTVEELEPRAESLRAALLAAAPRGTVAEVVPMESETGSGALPTLKIPSAGVAVGATGFSPDSLARALRHASPGIFTRIHGDRVCLDVRTLLPGEEIEAAAGIARVLARTQP